MVKQTIQIFCRLKPPSSKARLSNYDVDSDAEGKPRISFVCPRELTDGSVNNKKEQFKFRFERVFATDCRQEDVFEHVARPVINNVLSGYNGTIFAYGQTGSGKTFTVTGGAERYADRGIIPRTLSYIFAYFEQRPEFEFSLGVSYLEIYNENGYDLLDPKHEAARLEDLPKVTLFEDAGQQIHLKNLSVHPAASEEDALNLLFVGDTNRMIAETPMNQASTRSHCIFTAHLTVKEVGSATVRRAKLHLVDLAGSERVSKTGVNGLLLTEAKYINLSLHYLEQVIVALSERSRSHVPYRNSMMTSVLRDSLGGNCMTTMIATLSVESANLGETISTCRFAQRVAIIKNDAVLNEELDPSLLISRLRSEVAQLKAEIAALTGEQRDDELTEEELQMCRAAVDAFLADTNASPLASVGFDGRKLGQCFRLIRDAAKAAATPAEPAPPQQIVTIAPEPLATKEVRELRETISQRDNEIVILVGMLKQEKRRAAEASVMLQQMAESPGANIFLYYLKIWLNPNPSFASTGCQSAAGPVAQEVQPHLLQAGRYCGIDVPLSLLAFGRSPASAAAAAALHQPTESTGGESDRLSQQLEQSAKARILGGQLSLGRQEAFELFKRDYAGNPEIERHKQRLRDNYGLAKQLGASVNESRQAIERLKAGLERARLRRALGSESDSSEEAALRADMEQSKAEYRDSFQRLKSLKAEIEHQQHQLEMLKVRLVKDFEAWWAEQSSANAAAAAATTAAWPTPPGSAGGRAVAASSGSRPPSGAGSRPGKQRTGSTGDAAAGIQLTGDKETDAEIMAFMRARQNLLKQSQRH
uniref:Kinesin-like protein n=1 Tax=Macrostomum lignano TaxID=282301 RepID=A0A1I8GSL4_9PLAT